MRETRALDTYSTRRSGECPDVVPRTPYVMIVENQPVLYYLENGPTRSFVREELQVVPINSGLPPKIFNLKNNIIAINIDLARAKLNQFMVWPRILAMQPTPLAPI